MSLNSAKRQTNKNRVERFTASAALAPTVLLIILLLTLAGCGNEITAAAETETITAVETTVTTAVSSDVPELIGGFKKTDEGTVYLDENGSRVVGWLELDGEKYYFTKDGTMARGWTNIDNVKYYFSPGGMLLHGDQVIDGYVYELADDGHFIKGWFHDNGDTYYYIDDVAPCVGKVLIDGKMFYFGDDGKLLRGTQLIDGITYVLEQDGSVATGWYDKDGERYYKDCFGVFMTGWQTIDGNKYYFFQDGKMAVNTTVGIYELGSNGIAYRAEATKDNLGDYCIALLEDSGSDLPGIYDYMKENMVYKLIEKTDYESMAAYAINYKRGACYHYASLTYYLLKAAGYEAYIIDGKGLYGAEEHYWNLVYVNDNWYHYDTLQRKYLQTDAEVAAAGFVWDRSRWPATP